MVHMLECENPLMTNFMRALHAKSKEKGSYYKGVWVINYAEDINERAYVTWMCKRISDQTETTVATLPSFEKQCHVYENMVVVG